MSWQSGGRAFALFGEEHGRADWLMRGEETGGRALGALLLIEARDGVLAIHAHSRRVGGTPQTLPIRPFLTEVNFKIVGIARRICARLKNVTARAASPGRPVLPRLLIETFRTPAAAARRRRRGGAKIYVQWSTLSKRICFFLFLMD